MDADGLYALATNLCDQCLPDPKDAIPAPPYVTLCAAVGDLLDCEDLDLGGTITDDTAKLRNRVAELLERCQAEPPAKTKGAKGKGAKHTEIVPTGETLEDRREAHSNLDGNDAEIDNLANLLGSAWAFLTPAQQAQVLADNRLDPHFRY